MQEKDSKLLNVISIVVFVAAMAVLAVVAIPLITNLNNPEAFKAYIDSFGAWGFVMMFLVQIAQIVVALIPGEVVEFLAGTLYGWFGGLCFCLFGIAVGQTIIFKAVKTLGKGFVEKVAGSEKLAKFKFLQDEKKLKAVVFLLFFIPGTPKDAITYIVPLTKMKLRDFLIITLTARIPSVVSSTLAGAALMNRGIETTIIIYAVIAVISLLGVFFYKLWEKKHERQ